MLSVLFTEKELRYAQVVDFKGEPFVESLGVIPFEETIKVENASTTLTWSESLKDLHKKLGFPEKKITAVIPAKTMSYCFQTIDSSLTTNEKRRFLDWQGHEILDYNNDLVTLVHQKLIDVKNGELYISVAFPSSLKVKLENACERSEFQIVEIVLDIQSIGQLLQYGALLNEDETYCLYLDKGSNHFLLKFNNNELASVVDLSINSNNELYPVLVRGNQVKANSELKYFNDVLKGVATFDNTSSRRIILDSRDTANDSDDINNYDFLKIFNFRNTIENKNVNQYATVLGALTLDIMDRF